MSPPQPVPDLLGRAASLLSTEAARWQRVGSSALESVTRSPSPALRPDVPLEALAPLLSPEKIDELRRLGSTFLESLLTALGSGKLTPRAEDEEQRVPLIRCLAPVNAGETARASLRVANEESTPSEVAFYASNFVADSGYELPSLLVSVTPRLATIAAGAESIFEIEIAVPRQAVRGSYSGVVQATGCKYVKAVVTVDVL